VGNDGLGSLVGKAMKRRAMLAGTGMLVTGSGIISTSAAFGDSVTPASDFRVISAEKLEVRAGSAFENPKTDHKFVAYDDSTDSLFNNSGLNSISADDVPVATVNDGVNDQLIIETAISLDDDGIRFENILEVANLGTVDKEIGISYDRQGQSGQGAGQYGEDVTVGGDHQNELTDVDVQQVYQFKATPDGAGSPIQISPDPTVIGDDSPSNTIEIAAGATKSITLEIDFGGGLYEPNSEEHVFHAAEFDGAFTGSIDTVDMLDGITFGANDT